MGLYKTLNKALKAPIEDVTTLKIKFKNQTLPLDIFSFVALDTLFIQSDELEYIPEQIENLKTLTQVHIQAKNLKQVPKELVTLPQLRVLSLNNCHNYNKFISNIYSLFITSRNTNTIVI